MVMLLTLVESLRTCFQWLLHGLFAPAQLRRKRITQPVNRKSHLHTQQKPDWLKQEIVRLKAVMPRAGCRTIADICNRRFAASRKVTVGKTFVHEILLRHEYDIQILRRNLKHAKPKLIARNCIWGIDLTGKTDAQGKLYALLGIIDHGSRALLHLQALTDKCTSSIIEHLQQSIRLHGKPKVIRTDNESIFTCQAFAAALEQLGIRHQRSTPGCPWQNGRIERLFGTLKDKLDQWLVTNIEQLNADLTTFRHWYNHVRPHQNLDGRTPAEAWNGTDPYKQTPKEERWFEAWDGLLSGYYLRY